MMNMNWTDEDLVLIYKKIKLNGIDKTNSASNYIGEYSLSIDSEKELQIINVISSSEQNNFQYSGIHEIRENNFGVGDTISISLYKPEKKVSFYKNTRDFISNNIQHQIKENKFILNKSIYIQDIDYFSKNPTLNITQEIKSYKIVLHFIKNLIKMAIHHDTIKDELIFNNKKTFKISTKTDTFYEQLTKLNNTELAIIDDLSSFLVKDSTNNHFNEKKAMLSFVLYDTLDKKKTNNFVDIINNISLICENIKGQYSLYLENFAYGKFLDKLEKDSDNFAQRTNNSINKVLPQVLAIPVLTTTLPTLLNKANGQVNNSFFFFALLIYCFISFLSLSHQKIILDHIKNDVTKYGKSGALPKYLNNRWETEKKYIINLLKKQNCMHTVLVLTTFIFTCYLAFKLSLLLGLVFLFILTFYLKRKIKLYYLLAKRWFKHILKV